MNTGSLNDGNPHRKMMTVICGVRRNLRGDTGERILRTDVLMNTRSVKGNTKRTMEYGHHQRNYS